MLPRTNCGRIFHSLSLLVTNSPEYPTLRGGREPTSLVESARHPPGRPAVDPGRPLFFQSMIRKSGNRFSLGTNAKRLPGDHAQTKNTAKGRLNTVEYDPRGTAHCALS